MIVYENEGTIAYVEDDTVHIEAEGVHQLSMTTGEFMRIAIALTDEDIVAILPTQDKEYCG